MITSIGILVQKLRLVDLISRNQGRAIVEISGIRFKWIPLQIAIHIELSLHGASLSEIFKHNWTLVQHFPVSIIRSLRSNDFRALNSSYQMIFTNFYATFFIFERNWNKRERIWTVSYISRHFSMKITNPTTNRYIFVTPVCLTKLLFEKREIQM